MSPWPGAFACVLVLLVLVALIGTVAQRIRARRRFRKFWQAYRDNLVLLREAQTDNAMRRGMKTAQRMGWLPKDDCQ